MKKEILSVSPFAGSNPASRINAQLELKAIVADNRFIMGKKAGKCKYGGNMDVIVKKSQIEGKGVFANRDFKKGEIVIKWSDCSKELTKKELSQLPNSKKRYVSYLGNEKWVLFESPGKFVNHSCDPNTKAINGCDVATRHIKNGEEITADYVAEKVPDLNMKCNCGSKKCRGVITGKQVH